MGRQSLYGKTMPAIYQRLKEAKIKMDNHCSDLYVKVTPNSKKIVEEYVKAGNVTVSTFKSEVDGRMWYDLPFQYTPYWDEVSERSRRRGGAAR